MHNGYRRKDRTMNKLRHISALLVLLLVACSSKSLNQNHTSNKKLSSTNTQTIANTQSIEQQAIWYADSNQSSYTLLLKPQGIFSFDLQKGFTGSAAFIKLSGKHAQQQQSQIYQQALQNKHVKQHSKQNVVQQEQTKTKALVKKGTNLNWLYLLLALPIAMGYYCYRKYH